MHRELLGLRPEEVVVRLKPPMSARTLQRWEARGVPTDYQRNTHRDAWVEQLAEIYGVDPNTLTNGKAS